MDKGKYLIPVTWDMNLLYIANLRLPTEKAYGIQITKMCEAFARTGTEVQLLYPYRRNPVTNDLFGYYGIAHIFKVQQIPALDFYLPGPLDRLAVVIKNFWSSVGLARHALKYPNSIIYSRDELPLFFLSFFRENLVFEAHRFSLSRSLMYWRFKSADVTMVTISKGLKDIFVQSGFPARRIVVAHDGVDIKQFSISQPTEECRTRFHLPLDRKIIGYIGQLSTLGMSKGINTLLDAFKRISQKMPRTLLLIVGGSPADVQIYKRYAHQRGLSRDQVLFIGRTPYTEIPIYMKACDVLVAPYPDVEHYRTIMSPLKIFEYMASGQPIVASDLPSIREILNERSAFLVKPDDSRALADGIRRALGNPYAVTVAEKARDDVNGYTWDKRAQSILQSIKNTRDK